MSSKTIHHRSPLTLMKDNKHQISDESRESLIESGGGYDESSDEHIDIATDLRGDYLSILLLLLLYILQGIPLGLAGSIPLILSNRNVSYGQQAVFSFVSWPFSIKLLWAPIVDSLYWSKFGRRKTWMVPSQYLIALFMILLSYTIDSLINVDDDADGTDGAEPRVYLLTIAFLVLNFLAATQDIAVDGWALTMLSRKNIGYASTCNSVGQTAGFFLGNVVFLALESADFCNKYIRSVPQKHGLVTLSGFLYFWGIVFIVTTTLVMILKKESVRRSHFEGREMSIIQTYSMLYRILCMPCVRLFAFVLLTCKIGFAITDSATGLKLIESGVHKENLALLAIPIVPLQIILPWVISRYTTGPKPLNIFIKAFPFRLFFGLIFAVILWWTKVVKLSDGSFPTYYYVIIVFAYGLHQIALYSMFVSVMAFHARVSDPKIGGTYMTLLNTLTNLGGNWPSTLSLWLIDPLTYRSCSISGISCNDPIGINRCKSSDGECYTFIDGYYIEVALCTIIGLIWLKWGRSKIQKLQSKPLTAWKCQ